MGPKMERRRVSAIRRPKSSALPTLADASRRRPTVLARITVSGSARQARLRPAALSCL
jgi:hypothetical protein